MSIAPLQAWRPVGDELKLSTEDAPALCRWVTRGTSSASCLIMVDEFGGRASHVARAALAGHAQGPGTAISKSTTSRRGLMLSLAEFQAGAAFEEGAGRFGRARITGTRRAVA